jgi:hypothetical protein
MPGPGGRKTRGERDIGARDRLVAATAITAGWRVGTANLWHFDASLASTSWPSPSLASHDGMQLEEGRQELVRLKRT